MGRANRTGDLLAEESAGVIPAQQSFEQIDDTPEGTSQCNKCQAVWTPGPEHKDIVDFGLCPSCANKLGGVIENQKESEFPHLIHDSGKTGFQDFVSLSSNGPLEHPPNEIISKDSFQNKFLRIVQQKIEQGEDVWGTAFEDNMVDALHHAQITDSSVFADFPAGSERERKQGLMPSLAWKDDNETNPGADIYVLEKAPESELLQEILRSGFSKEKMVLTWDSGEPKISLKDGQAVPLLSYLQSQGASKKDSQDLVQELKDSCVPIQCKTRRSAAAVKDYDRVEIDLCHNVGSLRSPVRREEEGNILNYEVAFDSLRDAKEKLTRFRSVVTLQALSNGRDDDFVLRLAETPSAVLDEVISDTMKALEKKQKVSKKKIVGKHRQVFSLSERFRAKINNSSAKIIQDITDGDNPLSRGEVEIKDRGGLRITTGLDGSHIVMDATIASPQGSVRKNLTESIDAALSFLSSPLEAVRRTQRDSRYVSLPEDKTV